MKDIIRKTIKADIAQPEGQLMILCNKKKEINQYVINRYENKNILEKGTVRLKKKATTC